MSLKDDIKTLQAALIPDNITGDVSPKDVRDALALTLDNLSNLGSNYYGTVIPTSPAIAGVAEGATVLPTADGVYTNFNSLERNNELCVFVYESTTWVKKVVQVDTFADEVLDVSGSTVVTTNSLRLLNGVSVDIEATATGDNIEVYFIKEDTTAVYYGKVTPTARRVVLTEDYVSVRYFSSGGIITSGTATVLNKVTIIDENIDLLNTQVERIMDEVLDMSGSSVVSKNSDRLLSGSTVAVEATHSLSASMTIYLQKPDLSFVSYGYVTSKTKDIILIEDYILIRYYSTSGIITGSATILSDLTMVESEASSANNLGISDPQRLLVLGDSYSAGSPVWLNDLISKLPNNSEYISLGVIGATVKDKFTDRVTYPYTSRPVSSVSTGNLNTLSCQFEKLERLMAGVDLDPGEEQIYTAPSEYPTIIILEGGMNDTDDSQVNEDLYIDQILEVVQAYRRKSSQAVGEAIVADVAVLPNIESINRTIFGGAYRYLADKLITLFPDAIVFITTCSPINYFTADFITENTNIARQQRKFADMISLPVIDWHANVRFNHINVKALGTGTAEDPYVYDQTSDARLSYDGLHPNPTGSLYFSNVAYNAIKNMITKY